MSRPEAGPPSNMWTTGSAGPRTAARLWTAWWRMLPAASSMSWCAGGSIVSGGTSDTSSSCWTTCRPSGWRFVSLAEGIDATTPAGRLQLHILGAIAEFERARMGERVKAGLARARAQGKTLGRPRTGVTVPRGLTVRRAAALWGVSKSTAAKWLNEGRVPDLGQTPPRGA